MQACIQSTEPHQPGLKSNFCSSCNCLEPVFQPVTWQLLFLAPKALTKSLPSQGIASHKRENSLGFGEQAKSSWSRWCTLTAPGLQIAPLTSALQVGKVHILCGLAWKKPVSSHVETKAPVQMSVVHHLWTTQNQREAADGIPRNGSHAG